MNIQKEIEQRKNSFDWSASIASQVMQKRRRFRNKVIRTAFMAILVSFTLTGYFYNDYRVSSEIENNLTISWFIDESISSWQVVSFNSK